jgi:hypothetical protein
LLLLSAVLQASTGANPVKVRWQQITIVARRRWEVGYVRDGVGSVPYRGWERASGSFLID